MTHTESSRIANELKQLAGDYLAGESEVADFEQSDMMMRNAAQVRFVSVLVSTAHDGYYDALGEAWIDAGHRFLAAVLERARMDAVHESRASRRADKAVQL